jgi:LuxR family quorum sensing-dependent transcriptional regulator
MTCRWHVLICLDVHGPGGRSMLAFVERYFALTQRARTDADIIDILGYLSADLGYSSGYLIEYAVGMKSAVHVLDSNTARVGWWQEYIASGLRTNTDAIAELLGRGGVQQFSGDRFADPKDTLLAFARKVDMVDCLIVPVSHDGVLVGLGGFSGKHELTLQQQISLQLVVYNLFAQVRTFRNIGVVTASEQLTPREKEVMVLSAEGLTSVEIAERLGMSPRTVNQHVDNVATKLGTKNRVHTVAEAIRHGML